MHVCGRDRFDGVWVAVACVLSPPPSPLTQIPTPLQEAAPSKSMLDDDADLLEGVEDAELL